MLGRTLPEKPAWATAKHVDRPAVGTPALEVAKSAIGVAESNGWRLTCFGRWYDERRLELATGKPARPAQGCPE